jgi:hypothetical protein
MRPGRIREQAAKPIPPEHAHIRHGCGRIVMAEYARHYHGRRPHRGLQLQPPRPDHPVADLSQERIKRRPVGLLNEYERAA